MTLAFSTVRYGEITVGHSQRMNSSSMVTISSCYALRYHTTRWISGTLSLPETMGAKGVDSWGHATCRGVWFGLKRSRGPGSKGISRSFRS